MIKTRFSAAAGAIKANVAATASPKRPESRIALPPAVESRQAQPTGRGVESSLTLWGRGSVEAQTQEPKQAFALASYQDRIAQSEAGDAQKLVKFRKQHIGLHRLRSRRGGHRPKLDLFERSA